MRQPVISQGLPALLSKINKVKKAILTGISRLEFQGPGNTRL